VSAENWAAVVAAAFSGATAVVLVVVVRVLSRRARELQEMVRHLDRESLPLVRDARVMVDQAATEMERVGDALGSAEAVSATVDSASRLAYRAFANPVVKTLAFGTGAGTAVRRLFSRRGAPKPPPRDVHATAVEPATRSSVSPSRGETRHARRHRARELR